MQIRRVDAQTIAFEKIDGLAWAFLADIARRADPEGNAAAEARLFSSPTHGAEPQMDEEWKEYVEPDLRKLFSGAVGTVQQDLTDAVAAAGKQPRTVRVAVDHLDAWIHALNQARLATATRFEFSEEDMERPFELDSDERSRALFAVRFYGLLQEFLLQQLEDPEAE